MVASFKAFMNQMIDYAGLFPPAELPLDEAIQNYARYREEPDSWMLSRFIIPAGKLDLLEPYADQLFREENPFEFSLLGKATDTVAGFLTEIKSIVDQARKFNDLHGGSVRTDLLEIKIPAEVAFSCDPEMVREALDRAAEHLVSFPDAPGSVFYELILEKNWENDIETVIEGIALHNKHLGEATGSYRSAGYKLRCGGVESSMFPSTEQVAFALNRARDFNVAMKCTAGLHHPVRLYHESVQTKMHGFFNVFGGAMLSRVHGLSDEQLVDILCEEDADQFTFTDSEFSWNDLSITAGDIGKLREKYLVSFGSCSFDEPREDLEKLNLPGGRALV